MSSFLSELYIKPKLTDLRLINKIIQQENNKVTFEKKAILYIKNFFLLHWKIIIVLLIIIALFYWRYKEIQNIRYKNNKINKNNVFTKTYYSANQYENDSDYETSTDS